MYVKVWSESDLPSSFKGSKPSSREYNIRPTNIYFKKNLLFNANIFSQNFIVDVLENK